MPRLNPWSYAPQDEIDRLQQMARMAQPQIQPVEVPQVQPQQEDDGYSVLGEFADAVRQSQQRIAARGQQATPSVSSLRDNVLRTAGLAPRQQQAPSGGGFLDSLGDIGGDVVSAFNPIERADQLRSGDLFGAATGQIRGVGEAGLGALGLAKSYVGEPVAGGVVGALTDEQGHFDPLNPRRIINAELNANPVTRIAGDLLQGVAPYSEGRADYSRFQQSDAPTGVKVGADVLADPSAYLGPGALSKFGKVGSLLEQPLGGSIGAAVGAGALTQGAEELGLPDWAQQAAPITGALLGGLAGANPRALLSGAERAGEELTTGRLASERGSFDPSQIGRNSPGTPEGTFHEPAPLGGLGADPLPAPAATGSPLATEALAQKAAIVRQPGAWAQNNLFRKGVALFNPSVDQDNAAHIAHLAQQSVRSAEVTAADAVTKPLADRIAELLKSGQARYLETAPRNNRIANTFKDIADHPDFYALTPELRAAVDEWAAANDAITSRAAVGYGVDSGLYGNEIPGSVYAPTVPTRASMEAKVEAAQKGRASISASARTGERVYPGAYERMLADPSFVPVTDVHELTAIHNNAMAQNMANATFKQGVGGLSKLEMMEKTHPKLVELRDAAMKRAESLKGKLDTYLSRSDAAHGSADELARPLQRLSEGVVDRATAKSALAEAKRNLNRARVDAMRSAREAGSATAKDQQASAALNAVIARSERAVAKIDQIRTELSGMGEIRPEGMGIRLPALKSEAARKAVEESTAVTKELREAWGAARSPIAPSQNANRSLLRRGVAEADAAVARADLKAGEASAIDAAKEVAPEAVYSTLNQLQRRMDALRARGSRWSGLADSAQQELAQAQHELEQARDAWRQADPTRGAKEVLNDDYILNSTTNRYHPLNQSKSIDQITRTPTGFGKGLIDAFDELRATHLAGDASPITIQGVMGVFQDPILALRSVGKLIGNPTENLQRIALDEADNVRAYTFATGRRFGQPIAEFDAAKGLGRIPGVKAVEDKMFALNQVLAYEQWKNDTALLQKWNPAMTAVEAQHEAANLLSKTVPSLNPAERGLSPLRAGVERAALTSTSFAASPALLIKDMTSGLVKLGKSTAFTPAGRWQALSGREQLALLRGAWTAGSVLTASAASAAIAAESRGKDPADAIRESLDPRTKYFAAIQLGGGKTIPIGGPMRSLIKAIAGTPNGTPGEGIGNWLANKVNSPISGPLRLWKNEDYTGNPIRTGDRAHQLLDSLVYGFEQLAPTSLSAAASGIRTGHSGAEVATDVIGQFGGASPSLASPTEELNRYAREAQGKDFFDLEPYQREEMKKLHPDLWERYLARASDETQAAYRKRDELEQQQHASESALLSSQLSPAEWKQQMDSRRDQLRGAESIIYGDKQREKPTNPADYANYIAAGKTARDRYYRAIDTMEGPDGRVDWDGVDAWRAKQPKADQDYIDRNTGLGGTPLQQLRRKLSSDYYQLPVYRGLTADQARDINELSVLAGNLEGMPTNASPRQRVRALAEVVARNPGKYSDTVVYATQRRMLGLLKGDTARQQYEFDHPEIAILKEQAPLNAAQVAAVRKRVQ